MAQDQRGRPVREQRGRFGRRRRVRAARVRHRRGHVARCRGHGVRPRDRRVGAVAAQINKEDFVLRLALDELPRGGHPVSSLAHNAMQAHHDAGLGEGGLAFQSAARDPLVGEDGHLFFLRAVERCARGDRCGGVARPGVVLSERAGLVAPRCPQRCEKRSRDVTTAALELA